MPPTDSVATPLLLIEAPGPALAGLAALMPSLGLPWQLVSPALARTQVTATAPGVWIQDADQAGAENFALLRHLRQGPQPQTLLLVLLPTGADLREQALQAGATDIIDWPLDAATLAARLMVHRRLALAQWQARDMERQIEHHQSQVDRERLVAMSIFDAVLRMDRLEELPNLRWKLSTNSLFNGNLILAARGPSGNQHLLIGDFPGRGLAASIGSLPTAEIFYTMTAKGFELVDIIGEVHRRLSKLLPIELFFAVCFVDIDASSKTAHLWNGGLPDVLLLRAKGGSIERLGSRHMPLAILRGQNPGRDMDILSLEQGDRLLLFTNELWEAIGMESHESGDAAIGGCLDGIGVEQAFDCILERIDGAHHRDPENYNIALLEYRDDLRELVTPAAAGQLGYGSGHSIDWRYDIRLHPEALRDYDPRPMLTQMLVDIQGLQEHRERLYTVIAELFSNALEHGVMGLDSKLKSSPEGFAHYYMERERLLAELDAGEVRFRLQHQPLERGGKLTIEVWDSGPGFDFSSSHHGQLADSGYCGRGIGLIRQMCEEVQYFEPGNHVLIGYNWTRADS